MSEKPELYDVLAVNHSTGRVRIIDRNKSRGLAEAGVEMAVRRRGVETEFFTEAKAGQFNEGDKYE